jgi:hypothetical protein
MEDAEWKFENVDADQPNKFNAEHFCVHATFEEEPGNDSLLTHFVIAGIGAADVG